MRVEIDSVGLGYKTIKEKTLFKKSSMVDFYNVRVRLLSLKDFIEMYPIAYKRSRDDKERILKKIRHLEKFLGRKIM